MTEVQRLPAICSDDDCEGERGERGKRGRRGPTGPTGPACPESGALLGRQVFNVAGNGTYTPTPGTRSAIVRGSGGGGGGGGVGATAGGDAAAASGGNSGVSIEVEVIALPNTFLTGGPVVVGAGAPGMVGNGAVQNGGASTLLIGGVLLTAPGGTGGTSGGTGFTPPVIIPPGPPTLAVGVDYQSSDLGGPGFAPNSGPVVDGFLSGAGGSGSYGIGANGVQFGNGLNASGNGAGGSGGASITNQPAVNGGAGTPGIWIIEEYS